MKLVTGTDDAAHGLQNVTTGGVHTSADTGAAGIGNVVSVVPDGHDVTTGFETICAWHVAADTVSNNTAHGNKRSMGSLQNLRLLRKTKDVIPNHTLKCSSRPSDCRPQRAKTPFPTPVLHADRHSKPSLSCTIRTTVKKTTLASHELAKRGSS
jgi:hypothetical protein